jgi:hypothetical protein
MRSIGWVVVASSMLLGSGTTHSHAQQGPQSNSRLDLRISGPHLVRRGDKLKFKAAIINRSPQPVAFALRQGGWDCDGVFSWKITDTGDNLLPPVPREPIRGMVCCLTSGVSEDELIVLQPGEKFAVPEIIGDPSDEFAFPRNGFYRVSLNLLYRPGIIEDNGRKIKDIVKPGSKWELALKTGAIGAVSNTWNVYLTD